MGRGVSSLRSVFMAVVPGNLSTSRDGRHICL